MKTKLINFFREPRRRESLFLVIGVIIGITLAFLGCKYLGLFTPPNESDFYELREQKEIILEDFENVYDFENVKIYPNEKEIIIELVSEKNSCYILKMTFNKQKKFVSSEEISEKAGYRTHTIYPVMDKIEHWILPVFLGMLIGGLVGGLLNVIYFLIVFIYNVAKKTFGKFKE